MGYLSRGNIFTFFDLLKFYLTRCESRKRERHKFKFIFITVIMIIIFGLSCIQTIKVFGAEDNTKKINPETNIHEISYYENQIDEFIEYPRYADFLRENEGDYGSGEYIIKGTDYSYIDDNGYQILSSIDIKDNNIDGELLETSENGTVTYEVDIEDAGLYNIALTYYTKEGKASDIERAIFINDELQFQESRITSFERFFMNETDKIEVDNRGNDLKPRQVEVATLSTKAVYDSEGYFTEPLSFYLDEGVNTITLMAIREPLVLESIKVYVEDEIPTYEEYSELHSNIKEGTNTLKEIQGEDAVLKSSPMLYPISDSSTPAVEPYDAKLIKMNSIGGNNFKSNGQWIEWEIEVPKTGMYELDLVVKQNFSRGSISSRKLLIDGEIPFKEVEAIAFDYDKDYINVTLSDENDIPYKFYLTEGNHRLRLEVTYGEMAQYMDEIEDGTKNLNEIYRKVLMITGPEPDRFRDYQIESKYPELEDELKTELDRFNEILTSIEETTGGRSDKEAVLVTIISQLEDLTEDIEDIPVYLSDFKTNIGSLGTYLQQIKEQPLQIDRLYLRSSDVEKVDLNDGFFASLKHGFLRLFYSFVVDYNSIGNVADDSESEEDNTVTVWLGSATAGRDQANVLKSLIDDNFTKETGIEVNLMLVQMDSLLPATLSGQGPDVALGVTNDLPLNYGLRSALYDLSQFSDFEEVAKRFDESAMIPYNYGDVYYALPETETFYMMFYRKDILNELGLEPPETWGDVKASLSILAKNNLQFGLPTNNMGELMMTYSMMLFQNGGELYNEDGTKTAVDSEIGVETFKTLTEYFTDYTLERDYNFYNRFRTGEMPIGIADYTMYNTLQVSAPEIKGLWDFVEVPGIEQPDGTINNTVAAGGSAVVMLNNSKVKDEAWEFMKWWTSAETQSQYGRELESLMGSAARYPTANLEAISLLPWPSRDFEAIKDQFENVKGIQQVPGGYFTDRNVNNAFYKTVIEQEIGPREAIGDAAILINDEIAYKRKELGLD